MILHGTLQFKYYYTLIYTLIRQFFITIFIPDKYINLFHKKVGYCEKRIKIAFLATMQSS